MEKERIDRNELSKFSLEFDPNFFGKNSINSEFWILPYGNKESIVFDDISSMQDFVGPKQFRNDVIYLKMSSVWSENSYCHRTKVGCLIVKNKSIISDGYNGTPTGFPNICETELNETYSAVLHAEANAITKLAKGTQSSEGSTLYVTLSPCFDCAKLIIQSGIKRVVFRDLYRKTDSIDLLKKSGIEILRISNPEIANE